MLPINKTYLTNACSYPTNNPQYIVIHYTGNGKIDRAVDNVKWAYGLGENVPGSAHYYIDDTECYQLVPENRGAWAVGDDNGYGRFAFGVTNQNSISIEMCCSGGAYYVSEKTQNNAAELAASLLKKYGLGIDRLKRHWDCSRKSCPAQFSPINPYYNKSDGEQNWNKFKEKVKLFLNGKNVKEEIDYKGENDMFNEEWYLFRYKDIADAVKKGSFKSGYEHYKIFGKKEKRQPIPPLPTNFVESEYRELNKDVDDAIKNGTFTSGAEHWLKYGWRPNEKRKVCKNESDEQAKKRVAELEKQVKELEDKIEKAKKELK